MNIGARFYKADLHVHTPASLCYQCKTDKLEDIIDAAKKQGLQIIAITDHNQFEAVKDLVTLAVDKEIAVFPGLEITTENCHILALFEPGTDSSVLDDVLTECGIGKDKQRGNAECTGESAIVVLDKIRKHKGIAVAAHCDTNGKSCLFQAKDDVQKKILEHDCLCALEVRDLESSRKYFATHKKFRKKPFIQSSDAHRLDEVGAKYTYLKMDAPPTLEGLKLALLEPESRIRLGEQTIGITFPYIRSIKVDSGFLGGITIEFSPYLTCLIGGTGTGKSTIIECLRYCFNDISTEKSIQDDTFGKLKKLVGPGGVITVVYQTEYGDSITLKREVTDDPKNEVSVPLITDMAGNEVELLTKPRFYSQGEIALIARRLTLQMNLIDSNLDLSEETTTEKSLTETIEQYSSRIIENVKKIKALREAIDDSESGKNATTKRLGELRKVLRSPVFEEFPKWERKKRFLESPIKVFEQLKSGISRYRDEFKTLSSSLRTIDKDSPNYEILNSVNDYKTILDSKADSALDSLVTAIAEIEKQFLETRHKWDGLYDTKKAEYMKLLEGIKEELLKEAQSNFRRLQKKLDQLKEAEREVVSLEKVMKKNYASRMVSVDELQKIRATRFFKRDKLAKSWNTELKRTHVGIKRAGDTSLYQDKLDKVFSRSGVNKNDKTAIISKLNPRELFKLLWEGQPDALCQACGFAGDKAKRMVDFVRTDMVTLLTIDTVDLPDLPDIRFEKRPGIICSLEDLSTGEKSTALLSIAMMEGNCPIIIDQPEDSLDTKYIYEEIVSKVKRQKEERQFVCTSHNANIVVSADSDLTHVLDATVSQAVIESSGGIENRKTNELMLTHLEGGEQAFRLRTKKYLLPEP